MTTQQQTTSLLQERLHQWPTKSLQTLASHLHSSSSTHKPELEKALMEKATHLSFQNIAEKMKMLELKPIMDLLAPPTTGESDNRYKKKPQLATQFADIATQIGIDELIKRLTPELQVAVYRACEKVPKISPDVENDLKKELVRIQDQAIWESLPLDKLKEFCDSLGVDYGDTDIKDVLVSALMKGTSKEGQKRQRATSPTSADSGKRRKLRSDKPANEDVEIEREKEKVIGEAHKIERADKKITKQVKEKLEELKKIPEAENSEEVKEKKDKVKQLEKEEIQKQKDLNATKSEEIEAKKNLLSAEEQRIAQSKQQQPQQHQQAEGAVGGRTRSGGKGSSGSGSSKGEAAGETKSENVNGSETLASMTIYFHPRLGRQHEAFVKKHGAEVVSSLGDKPTHVHVHSQSPKDKDKDFGGIPVISDKDLEELTGSKIHEPKSS